MGFGADPCFFFRNPEQVRGLTTFDLTSDPPPDLVVEIDVANALVAKLPILAKLGVPKVWRSTRAGVSIHVLDGGSYRQTDESPSLAPLNAAAITRLLDQGRELPRREWNRLIQQWIRDERESEGIR